jgi:hypothetical protein
MCKGEINHRDPSLLAPLALFLNQYFNTFISEGPLLYLALVCTHNISREKSAGIEYQP